MPSTDTASTTTGLDVRPREPRGRRLERARPATLLAFRCAVAALFVLHPLDGLGLLGGGPPTALLFGICLVEIALIALVVLGLFARAAAFLLSGLMAFAFFVVHLPGGWNWLENGGEPPALYAWIFLLLVVVGPGPLSLDRLRAGPAAA